MEYMKKIAPEGRKYGIVKLVPPESWCPDFAVDTEVRTQMSTSMSPDQHLAYRQSLSSHRGFATWTG